MFRRGHLHTLVRGVLRAATRTMSSLAVFLRVYVAESPTEQGCVGKGLW